MDTTSLNLCEFLRRHRAKLGLSTADVERASRKGGATGISSGYISLIESGQVKNVSREKLRILASVYELTYTEMFAVACGTKADNTDITQERLAKISRSYREMSSEQQRRIDPLIDMVERECHRLQNSEE